MEADKRNTALWAAVLSAHAYGIYCLLGGVKFNPIFPILSGDYAVYFARILRTRAFWHSAHRFWGYDPFSMAGQPSGPVHEVGSHILSLVGLLLSSLPGFPRTLTVVEAIMIGFFPFSVAAFCHLAGFGRRATLFGFAFAAFFYGTFGVASLSALAHGFMPFQVALGMGLVVVGLFIRWIERRTDAAFIAFAVVGAVAPMFHSAAAVIVLPALTILFIAHIRQFGFRDYWNLAIALAVAVLVNYHWLHPYIHFASWLDNSPNDNHGMVATMWERMGFHQSTWLGVRSSIAHFYLIVFAIAGLNAMWRANRPVAISLAVWLALTAAAPYLVIVNCSWRYFLMVELLAFVFAGYGLHSWTGRVLPESGANALLLALGILAVFQWRYLSHTGFRVLHDRLAPNHEKVIDYITTQERDSGRFLVECEVGNAGHFLDLAPELAKAHVLGGSNAANFIKSRFTVFSGLDWKTSKGPYRPNVFGQFLDETTEKEFADHLALYNVHQVLAWTKEANTVLQLWTDTLEDAGEAGNYRIWIVKKPSTWFVEGHGRLTADYDHLRIADASPGKSILSFHWIDTLKVAAPVTVKPVLLPGSPLEFIEVDNPSGVKDIDVFNAGL